MTQQTDIFFFLEQLFKTESLISATLSGNFTKEKTSKVSIRPLLIKKQRCYQLTEQIRTQAVHRNLSSEACMQWLKDHIFDFKQSFFYTSDADYHLLINKKRQLTFLKKHPTKKPLKVVQEHNRKKEYIWQEGEVIPFLVHLGVMDQQGKVYAAKQDKFRQINRFLEMVEDVLPHLNRQEKIHVVDFGCGKAYLTFALYHFLKFTKQYEVHMIGLDLKQDVIAFCQALSEKLGYEKELHFQKEDINAFEIENRVDMVVSLHACDTATDAALEKAVRWQSKVILSAPCCQHELFKQVKQEILLPLLKHGILKERFSALVTDAARVQLLEILGYQAQILEFIDLEHTPKNLLIRAIKSHKTEEQQHKAWDHYASFKQFLSISPSLENRFQEEFDQIKQV